ncbi:plasmid mobilization relaxosome protein MobC, partial [Eubacteriales bacterium OttesenSCG-928-N14]|nr:plasmid mobilization relaxosome protein MobC [Eubacteriales bacterium OttesenSCG-928-N14]
MRNNRIRKQVWLNEGQADKLSRNAKRAGLAQEAYIRMLIDGYCPRESPPLDYYALEQELHGIAEKMNVIAANVHAVDEQMFEEIIGALDW